MRKNSILATGLILAAAVTGCGNSIPEMTGEQQELVVEYAADVLVKHSKNYDGKLVELSVVREAEAKEAAMKQAVKEAAREEEARKEAEKEAGHRTSEGSDGKSQKDAYNAKTGSYSGHYGKKPVQDEGQKQQIDSILNEKPEPFEFAMSALAAQNANG